MKKFEGIFPFCTPIRSIYRKALLTIKEVIIGEYSRRPSRAVNVDAVNVY